MKNLANSVQKRLYTIQLPHHHHHCHCHHDEHLKLAGPAQEHLVHLGVALHLDPGHQPLPCSPAAQQGLLAIFTKIATVAFNDIPERDGSISGDLKSMSVLSAFFYPSLNGC